MESKSYRYLTGCAYSDGARFPSAIKALPVMVLGPAMTSYRTVGGDSIGGGDAQTNLVRILIKAIPASLAATSRSATSRGNLASAS